MTNEAAKPTKLSNIAYCCKSRISPPACEEIERVVSRADPRKHERPITLSSYIMLFGSSDVQMDLRKYFGY